MELVESQVMSVSRRGNNANAEVRPSCDDTALFPGLIFAVQQWAAPLLFAWDLMEACVPKRQAKASSSKTDDLVCLGIVSSEEANILSQMYVGIEALSSR